MSEVTGISGVSQQLLHSLPSVPTACTVVLAGSSGHAGEHKERFSPVEAAPDSEAQKERSQPGLPTFDITANAGIPAHGREALQHFLPPERAGLFADMLGHLDFGAGGSTASPKLMVWSCTLPMRTVSALTSFIRWGLTTDWRGPRGLPTVA